MLSESAIPPVNPSLMLSQNARDVGRYLVSKTLDLYKNGFRDEQLHLSLTKGANFDIAIIIKDCLFAEDEASSKALERNLADALKPLGDAEKLSLHRLMADLNMLMVQADQIARFNFLNAHESERTKTPAATVNMLAQQKTKTGETFSIHNVIAAIKEAKREEIITAHPTNTNGTQRIASLAEMSEISFSNSRNIESANTFSPAAQKKLDLALATYLSVPAIPEHNLTPGDEGELARYYLRNHYKALPFQYESWDKEMSETYGYEYDKAAKLALHLPFVFGSWAGLDKDGNANINSAVSFSQVLKHAEDIIPLYQQSFVECGKAFGSKIPTKLSDDILKITELLKKQVDNLGNKINTIDAKELEDALTKLYNNPEIDAYPQAEASVLTLIREVRTFGACLGWAEYRENSQVILEAADLIIQKIPDNLFAEISGLTKAEFASHPQKNEIYSKIFEELLSGRYDYFIEFGLILNDVTKILQAQEMQPGKEEIHLTTFNRIEVGLLNPTIIKNHVLAETEGKHNLLAMELIKKCTTAKLDAQGVYKTTPHSMRSTPLYEDVKVMESVPALTEENFESPYLSRAVISQSQYRNVPPTFEIQIAQSDTARTGGPTAARYEIYMMHQRVRKIAEKFNTKLEFYVGGSLLDPMRGGMRAPTSIINLYDYTNFKNTVQGLDNLAYSNSTMDIVRHGESMLIACLNNAYQSQAKKLAQQSPETTKIIEQVTAELKAVADAAYETYVEEFFTQPISGILLAQVFKYSQEGRSSNVSSRATSKAAGGRAGTEVADPLSIDPNKSRAISFHETYLSKKEILAYIDINKAEHIILNQILDPNKQEHNPELKSFLIKLKAKCERDGRSYFNEALRMFCTDVRIFKEIIDRTASGMFSDSDYLWAHSMGTPVKIGERIERIEEQPKAEALEKFATNKNTSPNGMLAWMELQYRKAAELVYESMKGESPPWTAKAPTSGIRAIVLGRCLPHFRQYERQLSQGFRMNDIFTRSIKDLEILADANRIAHLNIDTLAYLAPTSARDTELLALRGQVMGLEKPGKGNIQSFLQEKNGVALVG